MMDFFKDCLKVFLIPLLFIHFLDNRIENQLLRLEEDLKLLLKLQERINLKLMKTIKKKEYFLNNLKQKSQISSLVMNDYRN